MMMAAKLPARFQDQAVIQTGYQDDTKELWSEIWNTLMGYINAEDSPNKLHQKDILVDLMSLFLSRVAHDSKFYLACTPAVLRASAEQASFRPLPAAQAFEALHEYAVRILAQPWRSEFTKINMYSGYYVHTVQSRLLEAHRLLEEMGFHVDAATQTATLQEPVDVDQVTKAAIDTLMASVECRIIERILESLPPGAFTPRGVLCYRAAYVGGVEAAIHHLTVTLRQRNFQHYFSPPGENGPPAGVGGTDGLRAAYPWQPVPPAPPPALPPVPTARLVDVGDRDSRDSRDSSHVWIPKTIRHQRPTERAPAAAALLPATLDEHQLGSWDLVDRGGPAAPAGHVQSRPQPQPPADSLDDSWGYVLNSLDRRRPASGRYDNVPETTATAPRGSTAAAGQRAATLPTPRADPRATAPRPRGRGYGEPEPRQSFDARAPHAPHPAAPLHNGAARPAVVDPRNGQAPRSVAAVNDHGASARPVPLVTEYGLPRPPPPSDHAAAAAPLAPRPAAHGEHGVGARSAQLSDHSSAPRSSSTLVKDHSSTARSNLLNEHNTTPRSSFVNDHNPAPRSSLVNDHNLAPRSSLVSDHNMGPRSSLVNEHNTGPRSAPPVDSHGGASGGGAAPRAPRSGPSSRASPRPEPSPEPAPAAAAARPRASPAAEPRGPELGAWPTRPEAAPRRDAAPSEQQWSCHACTYLNPVAVRVCGICGKSRQPVGRPVVDAPVAAPPVEPPDDLACPQCTLLNSRRARKCGACDAELK